MFRSRLASLALAVLAVPAVAQTNPLDLTFGDVRSTVTTDIEGRFDFVNALAFDGEGRTLVVGAAGEAATNRGRFVVARYGADGTLDPAFGAAGVVTLDLAPQSHAATAVLVQADGRIVVGGGAGGALAVVRLDADGALDASFGTGGVATVDPTAGDDRPVALFVDGTGVRAVGSAQSGGTAAWTVRLTASGAPDGTFGTGGVALAAVGGGRTFQARAAVRQPDGRTVVGGFYDTEGGTDDVALVRLTTAGALDASFGAGGVAIVDVAGLNEFANGLALAPDGAVVAVGRAFDGTRNDYLVARFTAAGMLDGGFGTGGAVLVDVEGDADGLSGAVVLGDGSVLAAGTSGDASGADDFGLVRLTPAGAVDTAFGTGGFVRTDFGGTDEGQTAALAPDGTFVVAGYARTADMAVAWYTTDGAPVALGRLGIAADVFPGTDLDLTRLAIRPGGGVALAATAGASAGLDAARASVAAVTADGTPDAGFGAGGLLTYAAEAAFARSVAVAPSGAVLFGGVSYPVRDALALRATPAGALDVGFGTGGVVRIDRAANDETRDLVPLPDGRALALVVSTDSSRVVRLTNSGALDPTFGDGGLRAVRDNLRHLAVDGDGRIVATGSFFDGTTAQLVVRRFTADGAPDATFGTGGRVTAPQTGTFDAGARALVQPDGRLLVLGDADGEALAVRFLPDGTLDAAFGTGGVAQYATSSLVDGVRLPDGGTLALTSQGGVPAVARLAPDGALDTSFGDAGVFAIPDVGTAVPVGLALDAAGRAVVGMRRYDADVPRSRVLLARLVAVGTVGAEAPSAPGVALRLVAFPNPASGPVRFRLDGIDGETVRVEVFDALGRRVAALHDGPLAPGGALAWDTAVAPGLYLVRAATAASAATVAVIRAGR